MKIICSAKRGTGRARNVAEFVYDSLAILFCDLVLCKKISLVCVSMYDLLLLLLHPLSFRQVSINFELIEMEFLKIVYVHHYYTPRLLHDCFLISFSSFTIHLLFFLLFFSALLLCRRSALFSNFLVVMSILLAVLIIPTVCLRPPSTYT